MGENKTPATATAAAPVPTTTPNGHGSSNGVAATAPISEKSRIVFTVRTLIGVLVAVAVATFSAALAYGAITNRLDTVEAKQASAAATDTERTKLIMDVRESMSAVRADVGSMKTDVTFVKTDVGSLKEGNAALRSDVNALAREVRMLAKSREPR